MVRVAPTPRLPMWAAVCFSEFDGPTSNLLSVQWDAPVTLQDSNAGLQWKPHTLGRNERRPA